MSKLGLVVPIFLFFQIIYFWFNFHSQMLRELIPGDLFKVQNTAEWKRIIVASYNQDSGCTVRCVY